MKRYLASKFFLFTFLIGLIVALVPGYSVALDLNYANFFPAPNPHSITAEAWGKEIEKRTKGAVKFTYFHGGTLAPADQIWDSTVRGIADIGFSCLAYTRGKFPLMEVCDLPLGLENGVIATKLINAFNAKFKPAELNEVHVLYLHGHGPGLVHLTKKPVYTLEDLKGMKIRATGLASKIVLALGAAPVGTTMPETYDALRTGVAEGAMAPFQALQGFRWGEVVKYSVQNFSSSYSTGFFVVMNKKKWDALSPDVKAVFNKVSAEYTDVVGRLWDSTDKDGIKFITGLGVKILPQSKQESDKWAAAVKPLLADYVKRMKEKNLPGEEALKFCQDFIAKNTKPAKK